jgi:hypothetical protein
MKLWGSKGRFRGICQNKQMIWYKIVANFRFIEIASVRKKSSDLFKCDQEQYISLVERVVCGSPGAVQNDKGV